MISGRRQARELEVCGFARATLPAMLARVTYLVDLARRRDM